MRIKAKDYTLPRPVLDASYTSYFILRITPDGEHHCLVLHSNTEAQRNMLRSTQLASDQARKCMAACPVSYHFMLPTIQHPLYTNVQYLQLAGRHLTPSFSPFPQFWSYSREDRDKKEKSRIQANAAGIGFGKIL